MWCHLSTLSRFPSKSCETPALITEKVGFSMCSYVLLAAFRHLVPNFFWVFEEPRWQWISRGWWLQLPRYSNGCFDHGPGKRWVVSSVAFLGWKNEKARQRLRNAGIFIWVQMCTNCYFSPPWSWSLHKMHWIQVSSPPSSINEGLMKHFQRKKSLEFKSGFVSTRRFFWPQKTYGKTDPPVVTPIGPGLPVDPSQARRRGSGPTLAPHWPRDESPPLWANDSAGWLRSIPLGLYLGKIYLAIPPSGGCGSKPFPPPPILSFLQASLSLSHGHFSRNLLGS